MGELRNIPGVGKKTEEDLQMLGYTTIIKRGRPGRIV